MENKKTFLEAVVSEQERQEENFQNSRCIYQLYNLPQYDDILIKHRGMTPKEYGMSLQKKSRKRKK